ncbi:uncharacterized protein HemX [Paraburkholderia sp. GAS448]|uniref:hypothetical protein n=1 Tax=Paraburkholderia sp. GAS448 TaxID=3035136 RepID=UPI003D221724
MGSDLMPPEALPASDRKQEYMMRNTEMRTARKGSTKARIVTASAVTLAIGCLSMAPALGADYNHQENQQQTTNGQNHYNQGNRQDQKNQHGQQAQRYQHEQQTQHYQHEQQTQHYQHDQYDAQRHGDYYRGQDYVYAPPPVVYAPEPSPGINLFIPLQFR